jgi:AcrR family transcriptional regulator
MARPKDQHARRESIRSAALQALAARGVAGVRLKDVAKEAGLSPATVLYYYPDMADLLHEVLQDAMDRFYERRREAIAGIDDARERLVATIRAGLPTGPDDTGVRLAWDAIAIELHNPTLAEFDRLYVERQTDLYERVLELGVTQGHFVLPNEARDVATNLVALEDYHGLRVVLGWCSVDQASQLIVDYAALATQAELSALAVELARTRVPEPA